MKKILKSIVLFLLFLGSTYSLKAQTVPTSLANTVVGGVSQIDVAYDFTPTNNFIGDTFKCFLNTVAQQAHLGKTGYALGTGGTILITINSDDPLPEYQVISGTQITSWLKLSFLHPHPFTGGKKYRIIFQNIDLHPDLNYTSVDAVLTAFPTILNGWTVSYRPYGRDWIPRPGFIPIMSIENSRDPAQYTSYGYFEIEKPTAGVTYTQNFGAPRVVMSYSYRAAGKTVLVTFDQPIAISSITLPEPPEFLLRKGPAGTATDGTTPTFADILPGWSGSPVIPGMVYDLPIIIQTPMTYVTGIVSIK